jgi:hypothetical protein
MRLVKIKLIMVTAMTVLLTMLFVLRSGGIAAQTGSRLFPETGKTVSGRFLEYWNTRGGLAQQGLPISDLMQERSDTDGKIYTVQYFERAVFELHPEFPPPNDVLLSLLGTFMYKENYPNGAPNQRVNPDLDFQDFPQTGKRVGGIFLNYWRTHGGLAQQGLPISDEFIEISKQDGRPYKVQYFERAVFEYHPEYAPPNNVLLSLLGAFRYKAKYTSQPPTAAPPARTNTANPPPATTPTQVPPRVPTATAVVQVSPTARFPYDGYWRGTNSGGGAVEFSVRNNVVTDFKMNFVARTCPRLIEYEHTNIPIVNGRFRWHDEYGDVFEGTFTASNAASGTLYWPEIAEDPPNCRGTWNLTWTARK